MSWHLFLDESGDLGFDFVNKKPSRYLTISLLAVSQPEAAKSIRGAVKKTLKRKVNLKKQGKKRPASELKGTQTSLSVKRYFYDLIRGTRFGIYAVTVDKRSLIETVEEASKNPDAVYNYIARLVVDRIPFEMADGGVQLIVDKSKGRREIAKFNESLEDQLQGRLPLTVKLQIRHAASDVDLGLSAADLFCWGVFRKYECGDSEWFDVFADKLQVDARLLFDPPE